MKRKLRPHQRRASAMLSRLNGSGGLFMAPGTGKTLVAIRQAHTPALVICGRDDFMTWQIELEAEGVPEDQIQVVDAAKHTPNSYLAQKPWTLVTYDLIKNQRVEAWIRHVYWQTAIIDEAHRIKRWKAQRTKAIIRATKHVRRRIPITGSPITNEPEDVFTLGLFIDGGRTFGTSWWNFMTRYYLKSGPGWYKKRSAKDEITAKLARIAYHVHEDDVLHLPPRRKVVKAVPMTGMQRRHYESVLVDWETDLINGPDEPIEYNHVIVQLAKLRQIASGFIYDLDRNPVWFRNKKMPLLFDMLDTRDELGRKDKVVVWCAHRAEVAYIAKHAPGRAVTLNTRKRHEREAARRAFRDDPKVRLFVANVDAGVGMNELVVAADAVYYSNSFKVASRQQSERRTRRIGSERHDHITYWDLVTEGTVDLHLMKSVRARMNYAQAILDGLRDHRPVRAFCT